MVDARDLRDADRRAFARGLDDYWQAELGDDLHPIGIRVDHPITRRRNARREPDELGAPFVHRERGSHHAASRIRDPQRLERALHGAVLAEAAMQCDEDALEAVALELGEIAHGGIEW